MSAREQPAASIAVLGASGDVGHRIVMLALERGYAVAGQTRVASRLARFARRLRVVDCDPRDPVRLRELVRGTDAVIFALGAGTVGRTTLFSEATTALVEAMRAEGVARLIAITGVGAGETRGHGGFFYDRLVFPLFTRRIYADKERQEDLIRASGLAWVIVRPAGFAEKVAPGPLSVVTEVRPETVLRRITRDEVAAFVLDQVTNDRYLGQTPFIGHP